MLLHQKAYQLACELISRARTHARPYVDHADCLVSNWSGTTGDFMAVPGVEDDASQHVGISTTDPTTFGVLIESRNGIMTMLELKHADNGWIMSFGALKNVELAGGDDSRHKAIELLSGELRRVVGI